MRDKFFLDTNIVIYSYDISSRHKQQVAQKLINLAIQKNIGIISSQVIQEFLNVALKKYAKVLSLADCLTYLERFLGPLCEISPSIELYKSALSLHQTIGYAFYDALIIAGALEGRCELLYSEDLQHGQVIQGMKIVNPFL